jgi:hypothetical protein
MEAAIERLQNLLSNKRIESYEIVGNCDPNGQIILQLPFQAEFKEDASYYVSLVELSTTSFFPNLTESNNKFYYAGPDDDIKEITLFTGCYEIKDYAEAIANAIPKVNNMNPIEISLSASTGRVNIKLIENYKVYFNRENTWRDELGFDSVILNARENVAINIANILKIYKVYLSCDICKGSYYNGKQSNILWSFNNSKRYGYPLSFIIQKRLYKELNKKSFNKITFTFTDDSGKPVDFMGSRVTICVEIKQV